MIHGPSNVRFKNINFFESCYVAIYLLSLSLSLPVCVFNESPLCAG